MFNLRVYFSVFFFDCSKVRYLGNELKCGNEDVFWELRHLWNGGVFFWELVFMGCLVLI